MYAATAFHHSYDDGGLFCIQASAHPSKTRDAVHVITQEFIRLTNGVDEVSGLEFTTDKLLRALPLPYYPVFMGQY